MPSSLLKCTPYISMPKRENWQRLLKLMEITAFLRSHLRSISHPPPTSWGEDYPLPDAFSFSIHPRPSFPPQSLACVSNHDHHKHSFSWVKHNTSCSQVHYALNNGTFQYCCPNSQAQYLMHVPLLTPLHVFPN